jgi:hypothetical protein
MHYKTMALEMIRQRPPLHDQLRRSRMLLPALELYARGLKASHEAWMKAISRRRPANDPSQTASEALELALKDLEDSLPTESGQDSEAPSLADAMAFLRRHTPPA